jgi:transcriptional regulator with XRE-family HTH domain
MISSLLMKQELYPAAIIRAARELLSWSQAELARNAGVAASTVHKLERDNNDLNHKSRAKLVLALEAAGIQFLAGYDEFGSGLRYQRRTLEIEVSEREARAAQLRREGSVKKKSM